MNTNIYLFQMYNFLQFQNIFRNFAIFITIIILMYKEYKKNRFPEDFILNSALISEGVKLFIADDDVIQYSDIQ
jgi:hypothetical protein